jgi:hypothetical protein
LAGDQDFRADCYLARARCAMQDSTESLSLVRLTHDWRLFVIVVFLVFVFLFVVIAIGMARGHRVANEAKAIL